jgi:ABC-2 type transport system ATP-binding protein
VNKVITVNHLSKNFKIFKRTQGFKNTIRSAFKRDFIIREAVRDVNFHIDAGEIVGYVGPNGAGKSTTIKILSGILTPSKGEVVVNGIVPYNNRMINAKNIGVVFGQRSQLYWDLPVRDSFDLHEKMYEIPKKIYIDNFKIFTDILDLGSFLDQPVRQLSLGQKMRANIAISLLHNPSIVYLDEPTIGLDIVAKNSIREFILDINKKRNTTFIITTHDMNDIEQVCRRLVLIDKGILQYDGTLSDFKKSYGENYTISVLLKEEMHINHRELSCLEKKGNMYKLIGNKSSFTIAEAVNYITRNYEILDIDIQDSDIESILMKMYTRAC